jgi:hypothetical protein
MDTARRPVWVLVAVLATFCLGASCGGNTVEPGPGQPAAAPQPRVESIPQVDLADLTVPEKRVFFDLTNDLLSPCGQPVSVARCATDTASRCNQCVPAARYLARLVTDGFERSEIEEHFTARYGRDTHYDLDVAGLPVRGAPMAPVLIVEFSDFECPYCGSAAPMLERILREFDGRVKLVFKNYPLDQHPRAMPAARAAVAAGKQGKFWEMHDLLFGNQQSLEDEDFERYAVQLGLDLPRFQADMASPDTQARIDADKAEGRRVRLEGTPTMFINGRRFTESPTQLSNYLREELDR